MGTRADFYLGKGKKAEWLGSIAWDGYPDGIEPEILSAINADIYREEVTRFLSKMNDSTFPKDGWPWPWENSRTTDYSYWFFDDKVWASCFGYGLFDPLQPEPELPDDAPKTLKCPDFSTEFAASAGSRRSGTIVFEFGI